MNNNPNTCNKSREDEVQLLAISYIPMQKANFSCVYSPSEALVTGTVFPELNLPFLGARGAK